MTADITIITHSGRFHADDVFAVATLELLLEGTDASVWKGRPIKIIRTRDEEIIARGDFVVDVGSVYDEEHNRFDHHQIGGAGGRPNGIPYASFGLVWKKFGAQITGSDDRARAIDALVVQPIDATDNGIDVTKPVYPNITDYTIQNIIQSFIPTWKEKDTDIDKEFLSLVSLIKTILRREIKRSQDSYEAGIEVEKIYNNTEDKRVIVLSDRYAYIEALQKYPEPLFVIFPNIDNDTWHVKALRNDERSFATRKDMPATWAGKRDKELADITGVSDAIFCHNKLFLAVAKTREGALALAKKAINA